MTHGSPPPPPAPADIPVWQAPPQWRAIDFVSDLHLSPSLPRTAQALVRLLQHSQADAVCLLGDVFELWVGDDSLQQPFEQQLCGALARCAAARPLFFMAGNRDFLFGAEACRASGMTALPDPTCLQAWGQRWLLSHGDAQCLEDADYQAFRQQVRSPAWQRSFLARPLAERNALAQAMRARSRMHQQASEPESRGDLDDDRCRAQLQAAGAAVLIHGHTHRPATHQLAPGLQRIVLSDWDHEEPGNVRGDVLRIRPDGSTTRLSPEQACSAA